MNITELEAALKARIDGDKKFTKKVGYRHFRYDFYIGRIEANKKMLKDIVQLKQSVEAKRDEIETGKKREDRP